MVEKDIPLTEEELKYIQWDELSTFYAIVEDFYDKTCPLPEPKLKPEEFDKLLYRRWIIKYLMEACEEAREVNDVVTFGPTDILNTVEATLTRCLLVKYRKEFNEALKVMDEFREFYNEQTGYEEK